jgi:hypothetical protein
VEESSGKERNSNLLNGEAKGMLRGEEEEEDPFLALFQLGFGAPMLLVRALSSVGMSRGARRPVAKALAVNRRPSCVRRTGGKSPADGGLAGHQRGGSTYVLRCVALRCVQVARCGFCCNRKVEDASRVKWVMMMVGLVTGGLVV